MKRRTLSYLILSFTTLFFSTSALAQSKSTPDFELYNLAEPTLPAVLFNKTGAIFFGPDFNIKKTYSWKQAKRDDFSRSFYVVDLDNNGKAEFIGAGKPTFVLSSQGDPLWFDTKGCEQLLVADFAANEAPDIACIRPTSIRILTSDNQLIWELDLKKKIKGCRAEDINGDQKADLECDLGGKTFARFDGNNANVITLNSKEQQMTSTYTPPFPPEAITSTADGKKTSVSFLEKDLNQDGNNDLITVYPKKLTIKNNKADEKIAEVEFSNNAKSYNRVPTAAISDTYTSNFVDDADATTRLLALQDQLAKCYTRAVKSSPFVGSGQLILKTTISPDAKDKDIQLIYTSLPDKKILTCSLGVIQNADFGPLKEGASGVANMSIEYSFKVK